MLQCPLKQSFNLKILSTFSLTFIAKYLIRSFKGYSFLYVESSNRMKILISAMTIFVRCGDKLNATNPKNNGESLINKESGS